MNYTFTKEDKETIITLFTKNYMSIPELANHYRCSTADINRVIPRTQATKSLRKGGARNLAGCTFEEYKRLINRAG